MEKRGLGHVEVILAFVLFIGFLAFALYFFNPLDVDRVVESSITYALDEVSENISVELLTYSAVIDDQISESIVGIPVVRPEGYRIRAEDSQGNQIPARYANGHAIFDRGSEKFVVLKFSEVYPSGSVIEGRNLVEGEYTISSSDTKEVWSEERALQLNSSYYGDYIGVKEAFNLPGRIDFGFGFDVLDGNSFVSEIDIPENLQVWSESNRGEIIDVNGASVFADLTVKVW